MEQGDAAGQPTHQVGRLDLSKFDQANKAADPEPPTLRGPRRLNKANRISCLIENLSSDTTNTADGEEDGEGGEDANDREVEDLKLGRERMSQIQSMFSGSPGCGSTKANAGGSGQELTPSASSLALDAEWADLRDEGLVSTNLQRFATGNVRGSAAAAAAGSPASRKTSLETNYIDKKHIESVAAKERESQYLGQILFF